MSRSNFLSALAAPVLVLGAFFVAPSLPAVPTASSGAVPDEIPSVFGPSRPAWASARSLEGPQGEPRFDRLPEDARYRVEAARATRGSAHQECLELGPVITDLRPGTILPQDFEDLVENSLAILKGTIVGAEAGFFNSQAGLLLEVEVERRLKESDRFWKGPHVYVYYPRSDFRIGSEAFCKRDPRWSAPPSIGDRMLLFPHVSPIDPDGDTMATETSNYELVFARDGRLVPPDRLKTDPVFQAFDTIEELASYTEGLLEGRGR